VPVYNVERYLIECLESLAAQDDGDFEVIVVDDGSTDKSATLARDFCETHRGFLYVRQENAGLGGARNTGVDRASGEFVTFIDSDDFVDRHYVSLLRREQMRGNFDVVSGQFCRINEAGMR